MRGAAVIDWGDGDYAPTAAALEPVAGVVLDATGLRAGERLVDVGCGTGNAVLEAARRGAEVVGFDPSARLVAEAARRLSAEGVSGEVRLGTAEAPPHRIAPADAVVSVFGVIFAGDAGAALDGMVHLAHPGGRIALSAWLPGGPIAAAGGILRAALPAGDEDAADAPRWSEPEWIAEQLEGAGARGVSTTVHTLVFHHDSPDAWFADQEEHHPVWRAARARLDADTWDRVRRESLDVLRDANEDASAFAVTSSYVVVRAER